MTEAAVPILVAAIFLCSILKFGASPAIVEENVEPQASLNGYYLDSLNEIASGVGYVPEIICQHLDLALA